MTTLNDAPVVLLIFVMIVLALNPIFHLFSWLVSSNESLTDRAKCPGCGHPRGGENSGDELIGIFQKSEERYYPGLKSGDHAEKTAWYEKYKVHYKCKYCDHEWTSYKTIRQ